MSQGINRVTLLGNLGADPELRYTQAGQPVLNLRLATTESYLDKNKVRQERTDWHSVVIWGPRGEALSKILTKGSSLLIEGSIRTSSYEKDGQTRWKTEIIGNNVVLTGGRRGGASEGDEHGSGNERPRGNGQGQRSAGGYGQGQRGGGQRPASNVAAPADDAGDYGGGDGTDEIPF